jgi:hypothetical protein
VGRITTEFLEDTRCVGLNLIPCQCADTRARCREFLKLRPRTIRDSESFRRGRTTNVPSADEQYVQNNLLARSYDGSGAPIPVASPGRPAIVR